MGYPKWYETEYVGVVAALPHIFVIIMDYAVSVDVVYYFIVKSYIVYGEQFVNKCSDKQHADVAAAVASSYLTISLDVRTRTFIINSSLSSFSFSISAKFHSMKTANTTHFYPCDFKTTKNSACGKHTKQIIVVVVVIPICIIHFQLLRTSIALWHDEWTTCGETTQQTHIWCGQIDLAAMRLHPKNIVFNQLADRTISMSFFVSLKHFPAFC